MTTDAAAEVAEMVKRLRDHETDGVTGSDRFHLREEAAALLARTEAARVAAEREREELRDRLEVARQHAKEEVWYWQGDGMDEPQSLTCPVIMRPEKLRAMLAIIEAADAMRDARYLPSGQTQDVLAQCYDAARALSARSGECS